MAKSKKNRQADFQKVKLKVGKKLKKADNVTKTSFQTRKIQVTQKLKAGQAAPGATPGAPSTKKKQNITELFTQCRHYSASVRQEAISGLKDLTTSFPELVQSHLADLIEKTAELLTDKDPKVRQGATRLLKTTLPKIPEKQISPFFPLLCAHLCCAMTHIVDEIQVESLTVLDVLLEQYPKLIISVSNQVLSNFVEQISRQKGQGESKRSLSTNPNSTVSTQKHRKSVFNRLHMFLTAMLASEGGGEQADQDMPELMDVTTSAKGDQLFPTYIKSQWDSPGFMLGSEVMDQGPVSGGQVGARIRDFSATLMPLLLECWVEAAPSHNFTPDTGTQLQQENAAAMYSVLRVTQVLLETLDTCSQQEEKGGWPRVRYMKDCSKHFLANFPYSVYNPPSVRGGNTKDKKEENVCADSMNLAICEIMSRFLPRPATPIGDAHKPPGDALQPPWVYRVTSYLVDFLGGRFNRGTVGKNDKVVEKITQQLIQARISTESLSEIVEAIFQRIKGGNRISQEKQTYLRFFASILFDGETSSIVSFETQQAFLHLLPRLLAQAVCETSVSAAPLVVSMIQGATCRRCLVFRHKEMSMVQQWFEPKSGVILRLATRERLALLSVLHCLSDISVGFMRTLAKLARHTDFTEAEAAYLLQCLQNRYIKCGETVDNATPHVTVLFQLINGLSKDEVINAVVSGAKHASPDLIGGFKILPADVGEETLSWRRHALLVQMVVDMIHQCMNPADIANILSNVIESYLKDNEMIPLQVAFGMCHFARLMPTNWASCRISGLCVAVLVFTHSQGLTCKPRVGVMGGPRGGAIEDEEGMLERLRETVCGCLVTELPGGLAMMRLHVTKEAPGASAKILTSLVKCVSQVLSLATDKSQFHAGSQFIAMVTSIKARQMKLQMTSQEDVTTETTRLIAELEYRLSTPPWT